MGLNEYDRILIKKLSKRFKSQGAKRVLMNFPQKCVKQESCAIAKMTAQCAL